LVFVVLPENPKNALYGNVVVSAAARKEVISALMFVRVSAQPI
jgi:hypothetical protein